MKVVMVKVFIRKVFTMKVFYESCYKTESIRGSIDRPDFKSLKIYFRSDTTSSFYFLILKRFIVPSSMYIKTSLLIEQEHKIAIK